MDSSRPLDLPELDKPHAEPGKAAQAPSRRSNLRHAASARGAALIATLDHRRWRHYLLGAGAVVLVAQLVVLIPALVTYITVTD